MARKDYRLRQAVRKRSEDYGGIYGERGLFVGPE